MPEQDLALRDMARISALRICLMGVIEEMGDSLPVDRLRVKALCEQALLADASESGAQASAGAVTGA